MPVCVFCGFQGKLSREHIWPQWIRKHAFEEQGISQDNVSRYWLTRERPGVTPLASTEKKGASRLSLISRNSCEQCNKGWMSNLEHRVKPVLTAMLDGVPTEISAVQARLLRAWAVKTALNFGYAGRGLSHPIPSNLGHDLYSGILTDKVPVGAQVWIAAYDPLGDFAYRHMLSLSQGAHPVSGDRHLVLRVVFITGHVVFYVRMPDDLDARSMVNASLLPEFTPIVEIAADRSIVWKNGSLDDRGISNTFNRHIHAGIYMNQHLDTWYAPKGADDLPDPAALPDN